MTVTDVRSVTGEPLELHLGDVTTIVGPNHTGKSNVLFAVAAALDGDVAFEPERDAPRHGTGAPSVALRTADGTTTVTWVDGRRNVSGPDRTTGPVVRVGPRDGAESLLSRAGLADTPTALAHLLAECRAVLPSVDVVQRDDHGGVRILDADGYALDDLTGLRGPVGLGVARALAAEGRPPRAVLLEEPEAFLHPGAQELLRERVEALVDEVDTVVLTTTESPFTVSRRETARVVAVARDQAGATRVVAGARGTEPQAALLAGLFRDVGFAAILDRATRLYEAARGVLIVEGGTDEAYLRIAAEKLGRGAELDDLTILSAGGAMAAALQAIVLRAETDTPLLVLLDNDSPGQQAKGTLVGRFGFTNRRQVTSYAEVLDGDTTGAEAEDVFDWRLLDRFVDERGERSITGKRLRHGQVWHFDLTSEAKSAFVSWVRSHADVDDLGRWGAVLDLLGERLPSTR